MKQYTIEGIRAAETAERRQVFSWLKKVQRWDEYMNVLVLARASQAKDEETHAIFVGVHHEDIIAAHYLCHLRFNPNELTEAFCIMLFPFAEDDQRFASAFMLRLAKRIMKECNGKPLNEDHN